ncbi:MAG: DUF2971 domain-containing protein [Thiogranum sp.]|nr:DUF2971 domain-containing protein [Thiogranum sp.]
MTLDLLPNENRRADYDNLAISESAEHKLREFFRSSDGYGNLYVTSFARGNTDDHDERGIRPLWELYTKHNGYCLQFDAEDVKRMLDLESSTANYEWLGLKEVKYGVDKNTQEFRELSFQLSQKLLLQILQSRTDIRVELKSERMWAPARLYRRVMDYCATHKDPCFEDEREVRIFAYPAATADARVFTGIAFKKEIRSRPDGIKYIALGESWRPGLVPRRVIIGTKAERDIDSILSNYSPRPAIAFANMPIA